MTTRWSMVVRASDQENEPALAELLQSYWHPLYTFIRRSGQGEHDAQDTTQAFIAHLLEQNGIGKATPERGRFRSYLLGVLKNFISNERRKNTTLKRGGATPILSIDVQEGAKKSQIQASNTLTPSQQYEHSWAMALLEQVMEKLRLEFEKAGRLELFQKLQPRLAGASDAESYASIASHLSLSESAVSVSIHRMRKRYGELLRIEIADTLIDPNDLESELHHLMKIVSGQINQ